MLGHIQSNKEYQWFVLGMLRSLVETHPEQIKEYSIAISKMLILNLDPLIPILKTLYLPIGRMAEMQVEIFRSLILMKDLKIPLDNWVEKLENNPVLRAIAGFTSDHIPQTSSYYDFIDRIFHSNDHSVVKSPMSKPLNVKLEKGEKLPPKNPGITNTLVDQIILNEERFRKRLASRPERFL